MNIRQIKRLILTYFRPKILCTWYKYCLLVLVLVVFLLGARSAQLRARVGLILVQVRVLVQVQGTSTSPCLLANAADVVRSPQYLVAEERVYVKKKIFFV